VRRRKSTSSFGHLRGLIADVRAPLRWAFASRLTGGPGAGEKTAARRKRYDRYDAIERVLKRGEFSMLRLHIIAGRVWLCG